MSDSTRATYWYIFETRKLMRTWAASTTWLMLLLRRNICVNMCLEVLRMVVLEICVENVTCLQDLASLPDRRHNHWSRHQTRPVSTRAVVVACAAAGPGRCDGVVLSSAMTPWLNGTTYSHTISSECNCYFPLMMAKCKINIIRSL